VNTPDESDDNELTRFEEEIARNLTLFRALKEPEGTASVLSVLEKFLAAVKPEQIARVEAHCSALESNGYSYEDQHAAGS
jgi:hypothetical protein